MTALTVNWTLATTPVADLPVARDVLTLLHVAPIRVSSGKTSIVVVPGESFDLPPGEPVSMTVELPRLKTIRVDRAVPARGPAALPLETDDLLNELADHEVLTKDSRRLRPRTSHGDLPPGRYEIKSMTVDVGKGLRGLAPAAASRTPRYAELASADLGVAVSGSRPVSLSAKVASRRTLPRFMMLPYVGPGANECRIVPVTPVGALTALRVEPTDPAAVLLMDYLIAGKFVLACAAARAIEKYRAGVDPLEWASPSYRQLLIGYSFALGRDAERLERWCRRTDAARSLGTDGLVLAAEAARLRFDRAGAIGAIQQVAGAPPPLLVHGADIGLRVATVLLAEIDQQSHESSPAPLPSQVSRLRDVRSEFTRLLFVADADSSPLSVPTSKDPAAALAVSRFRYRIRRIRSWLATGWRRRYAVVSREDQARNHQYLVGAAMPDAADNGQTAPDQSGDGTSSKAVPTNGSSSPSKLTGAALWVAIAAIAVWVGFSVALIFLSGKSETEWTRVAWVFGSIQAVAFAAAGALWGTSVQQQNVTNAQKQAASAQADADEQREDATKGRALAAVVQAEEPAQPAASTTAPKSMSGTAAGATAAGAESADALRQRHAQVSRALFGDLVK